MLGGTPPALYLTREPWRGHGAAQVSCRVLGQRQPARVPGAVREMNLALRRRPPVAAAQNLFSPVAENVIIGGTFHWRAQLPAHPTGTDAAPQIT